MKLKGLNSSDQLVLATLIETRKLMAAPFFSSPTLPRTSL